MTAEQYLKEKLASLMPDSNSLTEPSVEIITARLLSKKFRKYACTEKQIEGITNAVAENVEANTPIRFVFPYGGYKLWRLDEAPEADWAELFTMMYYAKWLMPIATSYKPGVEFVFSSQEIIAGRLNNLSEKETAAYRESFKVVLTFVNQYLPKNFQYELIPFSSTYEKSEDFEADLTKSIEQMEKKYRGLPTLTEDVIRTIELNTRTTAEQAADPKWREKVELIHQSFYGISKFDPYHMQSDKIVVFPVGISGWNCIPVGTTKTSVAKFWAGVGALKQRGDSFIETVLSPSQSEKATGAKVAISIPNLTGTNFTEIRIIED